MQEPGPTLAQTVINHLLTELRYVITGTMFTSRNYDHKTKTKVF